MAAPDLAIGESAALPEHLGKEGVCQAVVDAAEGKFRESLVRESCGGRESSKDKR